jgi:hypothetical protein
VLAVSDKAVAGVPLARLVRDDAGRWSLVSSGSVDAARAKAASSAKRPVRRRRAGR